MSLHGCPSVATETAQARYCFVSVGCRLTVVDSGGDDICDRTATVHGERDAKRRHHRPNHHHLEVRNICRKRRSDLVHSNLMSTK